MRTLDVFKVSVRGLTGNKMRSALTMLGVIIGVASVIALVSIGEGARRDVIENFESIGTNILRMYMQRWDARLTIEQVSTLKERVPDMEMVMPTVSWGCSDHLRGETALGTHHGCHTHIPEIREHEVYIGRFFTDVEMEIARPVCVLGWQVVQDLFAGRNPVGKTIYMDQRPFQIIGVMEEKGQNLGEGVDHMILVPLTVAQRGRGTNRVDEVFMKATNKNTVPIVKVTVERIFESKYGENAVYVWTQQEMLDQLQASTRTMTLMLGAIAGVSLLVGGIGVMNIMLVAVAERTREIGLRMAVGAKRFHVMLQFLFESAMLCSLGGVVGVLLGIFASRAVERVGARTAVSPTSIGVAFAFAVLVGFVFGVYPAYRASRLAPVEALRSD